MASERYHNSSLPLLRPSCVPVSTTVASADYSTVEESRRCLEERSVYSVHKRGRAPNWSDAETRFLLELWRDRFPLNKRRNSSAWIAIAKQLNKLLAKHCLSNFRSGPQCKARLKYLADEYKRVYKVQKEQNGNEREATFDYFEEMDAVLGCIKPNNPSSVVHISGVNAEEQPPLISSPPIRSTATEAEFAPNINVAHNSGLNEYPVFISPKAEFIEHPDDAEQEDDDDINEVAAAVVEPTKSVPRENPAATTTIATTPLPEKRECNFAPSDLMKFLEESQKRDHEFFRMLVDREGERELQRQKMMFDMLKEVAKIFKGDK